MAEEPPLSDRSAPSRPPRALAVWLALAVVVLALSAAPYWPGLIDDLLVTTAYAHEWVASGVIRWTTGEVVEGYSHFAWLVLLAGAAWAGADALLVAKLASMAGAVAVLGVLAAIAPRDARGAVLIASLATWPSFA